MAKIFFYFPSLFYVSMVLVGFSPTVTSADKIFQMGWLPPNINPAYGPQVDHLYSLIMIIVVIIFFLTEGALLFFIIRYRFRADRKAIYSHGNTMVEIIWSVIPALILIWLAFYQRQTWSYIKQEFPTAKETVVVEAFPEQFAWNFRYPGLKGDFGATDDIMTINQIHVPVNKKVLVKMTAKDVIHSFFIPFVRIKQDAVPGMQSRVWFVVDKMGCWDMKSQQMMLMTEAEIQDRKVALDGYDLDYDMLGASGQRKYFYKPTTDQKKCHIYYQGKIKQVPITEAEYVLHPLEIACAELCGLGHYKMRAQLHVEPVIVYEAWLKESRKNKLRAGESKWTEIWDKYFSQYNHLEGKEAAYERASAWQ